MRVAPPTPFTWHARGLCEAATRDPGAHLGEILHAAPAVGLERIVVDEHDDAHARALRDRVPDVDGVGDVDLKAAVVEEAGAVDEDEVVAKLASRLDLRREGVSLLRVADRRQPVSASNRGRRGRSQFRRRRHRRR